MKKHTSQILALLTLAAVAASGCAGLNGTLKSLSKDQAIVTGNINTIYGTSRFTRIGVTTNSVVVSPDGTVTINKQ